MTLAHFNRHVEKCRIVKTPRDTINKRNKNKDLVCKYCDKSFTKKELLNSHLKEHII